MTFPGTEPTKLLSAEEFALSMYGQRVPRKAETLIEAYAAALTALHEAIKQRDSALARVAELELELSDSRFVAVKKAHERDALAAEVAELRAALEQVRAWDSAPYRLRAIAIAALAAQPQRTRVKALLAALTEIAHYGVSVPLAMTQAQYDAYAARDMRRIAQTAIDGTQP